MAVYEITSESLRALPGTTFSAAGIEERGDLQRFLRTQIEIISPDTLIISEEFSDWEDSRRRIDLLGVDKAGKLVVIELKRTEDGGHMDLQAVRYAAMVSTLTFERAVAVYESFLRKLGSQLDARSSLLQFLEWDEPDNQAFAQDVRIVLAGADFSKELTTAVIWLNQRMLDIRCVRLKPYLFEGRVLVDAQQVLPIPEAAEYQVRLREKERSERADAAEPWDENSFLEELKTKKGVSARDTAQQLISWISPQVTRLYYGTGSTRGGIVPIRIAAGRKYHVFQLRTDGWLTFYFDRFAQRPEFADIAKRQAYLDRLNQVTTSVVGPDRIDGRPSINLDSLSDPEALKRLKNCFTWFLSQIALEPTAAGETDDD